MRRRRFTPLRRARALAWLREVRERRPLRGEAVDWLMRKHLERQTRRFLSFLDHLLFTEPAGPAIITGLTAPEARHAPPAAHLRHPPRA